MGEVSVKMKLVNAADLFAAKKRFISESEVREITIYGTVDTGTIMLVLPQDAIEKLGLEILRKVVVSYADERKEERNVAGMVKIEIGDRFIITECIVGPPLSEALIGQVVLEEMDLIVDCTSKTLSPRPESPFLPFLKVKLVVSEANL